MVPLSKNHIIHLKDPIMRKIILAAVLAAPLLASASIGTILSGNLTVDNSFNAYLSTSDSTLGTLIGSGNAWEQSYSVSSLLTPNVTEYLHVVATNVGGPGAFIGSFSLSNSKFAFANGTQTLLTNTSDWKLSSTGFGLNYTTPISDGSNGVGPWGYHASINSSAQWLDYQAGNTTAYFSTTISTVAAVPEPETYAMLLAGLGLIGAAVKRRKAKQA